MRAKLFDKVELDDGRKGFVVDVYNPDAYEIEFVPANKDEWTAAVESSHIKRVVKDKRKKPF